MAYQALYRQWRPVNFSQMVGQENIVKTLRNQVESDRVAHAYLFCGSRGTGKTSTAKILSRAVNCEHLDHGDPCGECESCQRLLRGNSLDVQEIDAASNNGVDQVRDLLDGVQYPPQYGRYKVYIVDEVHMLSTAAFNALLKTLEEPPEHVVFILATTEPQKVPATILSRCQRFDFGRIPAVQIAGRLREAVDHAGVQATDQALHMIARAAEGGMRDALSILDMCLGYNTTVDEALVHSVLGTADRSFLFAFADSLAHEDVAGVLKHIDNLMRSGREAQVFSRDVSQHLRTLLLAMYCQTEIAQILDLTQEDAQAYVTQAQAFSSERLMRILDIFMAVETNMRYASSPRIALETAAVKSCLSTEDIDVQAMTERIAELERKLREMESQLQQGTVAPVRRSAPAQNKPPERPQPAVEHVASGDAIAVWKSAMDFIKRTVPGKYALLVQGRFAGAEDHHYRWEAPENAPMLVSMWSQEANRKLIADALSEVTGTPCTFEAVSHGDAGRKPVSATDDGFLSDLRETFGAENVSVQDQPK